MIKFEFQDNGEMALVIKGSMADLASQIGVLVSEIYERYVEDDPKLGEAFRKTIWIVLSPGSPVWTAEER